MVRNFFAIAILLTTSGCAVYGTAKLTSEDGKSYFGRFEAYSRTIDIDIDGKHYSGFYIRDEKQSFGVGITGYRYHLITTTTNFQTGSYGRGVLNAEDGSIIECEFMYQGMNAIGTCVDGSKRKFNVQAYPD